MLCRISLWQVSVVGVAVALLTAGSRTAGQPLTSHRPVAPGDGMVDVIVQFTSPPGGRDIQRLAGRMAAERSQFLQDLPRLRAHPRPFRFGYRRVFNGVAGTLSEDEVGHARSLPYVKAVFSDTPVQAVLADSVPLIGADQVWSQVGATGTGVRIAVIDTGVDYGHPDLGSCFGAGCKVVGGFDFVNSDSDPMDDNGHGTHVAGIIAASGVVTGAAPNAQILAYKTLDAAGNGYFSDIIAALETAVDPDGNPATDDGADVANLSLGGWGDPDDPLSQAVDRAVDTGIVVVVAAGNSGPPPQSVSSPGTARKAITVGATDKSDVIAYFSSRGPVIWQGGAIFKPDIVAPGASICSSRWDSAWAGLECIDQAHVAISGTSMATPHVAGAAAPLLDAHPDWTPAEVKMALRDTALDLAYDVNTQGYGRLLVLPAAELPHAPPIASIATSGTLAAVTDIYGTATSDTFQSYSLYIGQGMSPASWFLITESTTPVSDGILYAAFDPFSRPDGYNTLRLDVTDSDGHVSQDRTLVLIGNLLISAPQNNNILRMGDSIEVRGSILAGQGFQNYIIEYGLGHDPAQWFTSGITLANGGTVPVVDGLLATWNTSAIRAGDFFTLRLTVNNAWGQTQEMVRDVHLDPTLKAGWPQRIPWDSEPEALTLTTAAEFYSHLPLSVDGPSFSEASLPTVSTGDPAFSALSGRSYYWGGYIEPVVSDTDGDARQEVVVYKGGVPPEVLVYRDDGSLYWLALVGTTGLTGGNLHFPLIADINGDGLGEVVVYRPDFGQRVGELYAFGPGGSLLPGWPISMPMDDHPTLLAADLDGDGNLEIVVKGNSSNPRMMVVVSSSGRILSQWNLPPKTWGGSIESTPAVGDLDGDGQLEIVSADPSEFAGYDWNTGQWNNTGVIHVLNMDGSELPGWPQYTDGIIFSSPAVGDINRDGQNEIVVGLMFAGSAPDYRYGGLYAFDRSGNVLPGWPVEKGWNFWSSPSLGDLDGDGDLEIAASRLGFVTYVFHPDGSLAAGWPQYTGWNDYYSTIMADVDGDGALDVLTTAGSVSAGGGVYAWGYDGTPITGFPKLTEMDAQAPVTVVDIDQDGQVELIASSDWDYDREAGAYKWRGSIYVWDVRASYALPTMEWPHFHHDAQHTGLYPPLCPNGRVDPGEECDDGNTNPSDGCTSSCTICGNSVVTPPEHCDGGNLIDGDGCDSAIGCVYTNNTASCDDRSFCSGEDTCSGCVCVHAGDPCAGGPECADTCDEGGDTCNAPVGVPCTDDGNVCTDNDCDGKGNCVAVNNAAPCNDVSPCTTGDVCSGGLCAGAVIMGCEGVTGEVPPGGGTLTTDTEGDGATPGDAVETWVTSPNAGTVAIVETSASSAPVLGFEFLNQQVEIVAPPASVSNPLIINFQLDASVIPAGENESTILIFRGGTVVSECTGAPSAIPDPCVSHRALIEGDVVLTVLSSSASYWNFATALAAQTIEVRVAGSSDDAEESASGSVALSSSDLELVYDGSNQTVGLRFAGVAIPPGARVVNAYVQFKVDETPSGPTSLVIQGQGIGNAPTFTSTSRNIASRRRTAASVVWGPAPWPTVGAAGLGQQTPNIAGVIQEIVDGAGWASGNALVLIISGTGERVAEAWDGDRAGAPLLHLEYRMGAGTALETALALTTKTTVLPVTATTAVVPTTTTSSTTTTTTTAAASTAFTTTTMRTTTTTLPRTECPAVPEDTCREPVAPLKASLLLKDKSDNTKDKLIWKWIKGENTDFVDLGDPLTADDYTLCIYEAAGGQPSVLLSATAPAGGQCAGRGCWKALSNKGFKYKDKELTPYGLDTIILKAGDHGKAKIIVKGKGAALGLPSPLDVDLPVTVQLQSTNGECWEADYFSVGVKKNEADFFKAKAGSPSGAFIDMAVDVLD